LFGCIQKIKIIGIYCFTVLPLDNAAKNFGEVCFNKTMQGFLQTCKVCSKENVWSQNLAVFE